MEEMGGAPPTLRSHAQQVETIGVGWKRYTSFVLTSLL